MAEAGLPPADLAVLLAVFTRPGGAVADIATVTQLTHSGAVRAVQRLGEMALVERRVGQDRRTAALFCTLEGNKRAREALARRRAAIGQLVSLLGSGERTTLARVSEKLLRRLPRGRADAWHICRFCDHRICRGESCPVGSAVS